jgi:co-chaperonin GroES (HSP10)
MDYKPLRNELLVVVDKEDKYSHTIEGTDITLFIERDYGWNEREKNTVNATVLHIGNSKLKEGTRIVCWHNCFADHNLVDTITTTEESVYGGYKKLYVYRVNEKHIFFYFNDNGTPTPMPGYIIAERIYHKKESESIILTELSEEKEQNRVVVVNIGKDCDTNLNEKVDEYAIKPKDVIIIETMADYEVVYADKGREHRLVRIKEEDIIAIDNGFEITDKHKIGV